MKSRIRKQAAPLSIVYTQKIHLHEVFQVRKDATSGPKYGETITFADQILILRLQTGRKHQLTQGEQI